MAGVLKGPFWSSMLTDFRLTKTDAFCYDLLSVCSGHCGFPPQLINQCFDTRSFDLTKMFRPEGDLEKPLSSGWKIISSSVWTNTQHAAICSIHRNDTLKVNTKAFFIFIQLELFFSGW